MANVISEAQRLSWILLSLWMISNNVFHSGQPSNSVIVAEQIDSTNNFDTLTLGILGQMRSIPLYDL